MGTLLPAILAGICIGLGGTVYLSLENAVVGSLMFGIGLFTILAFGFNLFTGKVGYALDNPPSYIGTLLIIWLGNFIGTALMGLLVRFTRVGDSLSEKAAGLAAQKLSDNLVSILLLAIGCGMCMYIAVHQFKQQESTLRCIFVVFPVMVFILCKFEHVIANMFYFALAGSYFDRPVETLLSLVVMTIGNSIGGLLIPAVQKLYIKQ
ncbi:MAG: formate/nitrite transporter family protein [Ruminococcaceae bacterium]|nr:formate/nitrite transporter family protein [Oscillospiraceae bacterium]